MKKFLMILITFFAMTGPGVGHAEEARKILFHLKTGLEHDDAQLFAAYNMIWAALKDGLEVDVLIDTDAVSTYEAGWRGRNTIEGNSLPERLRESLSRQFDEPMANIPKTYRHYMLMLKERGVRFHINSTYLVTAKIEKNLGTSENITPAFIKPATLAEMMKMIRDADLYMAY